ncbi:MAG TPA: hypothetical protein VIH99_01760, partial [Bdellovibrionota bacterium]
MYSTIKPLLVILAVGGAVTYFALRAKVLVDMLRAVTKPGPNRTTFFSARIGAVIKDVLLQVSVRRKLGPGIAHTFIFWGFVIITVGTVEMMVSGVVRSLTLDLLGERVRHGYDYLADFLSLGVLLGVGFGFFRRLVLRPKYLRTGPDALMVLTITGALMLSLILMNLFRIGGAPDLRPHFPVSGAIFDLLRIQMMEPTTAFAGTETFYWAH